MQDMLNRVNQMEQEILVQRGTNVALQQVIANGIAPPTRSGVDTRGLCKPDAFEGVTAKWRDWQVVLCSYTAACHADLSALMRAASEQLSFILVMVCRGPASTRWSILALARGPVA